MSEPRAPYWPRQGEEIDAKLEAAKLVVFDVDGTLTDGRIGFADAARVLFFHSHDGHGISAMLKSGAAQVAWVTGNKSMIVNHRASKLGVTYVMQGIDHKVEAIEALKIPWERIVYVGDDINDVPAMLKAGVAFAVGNATREAKMAAHAVLEERGGHGAARVVCDRIMRAKGYEWAIEVGTPEWKKP